MALKILLGVAVVIVVLLIVVATWPASFHIERSISIGASPDAVFAQLDDFHAWSGWSPWEKLDPQMRRSFGGAPSGTGAVYEWAGSRKVGEGRMTIEKSERPSLLVVKLEFLKPWNATNTATFTLAPALEGTKVTWAMDGQNSFVGKIASLFMNMDRMIGGDFERGLAAMKAAAEAG